MTRAVLSIPGPVGFSLEAEESPALCVTISELSLESHKMLYQSGKHYPLFTGREQREGVTTPPKKAW